MPNNNSAIYIAFGANLSNPKETFVSAIKALADKAVRVIKISGLWQSPAWPAGSGQPDYINACAEVGFDGGARALLNILHDVEAEFGRKRGKKNAARTLDLDLLDFKGEVVDSGGITLPHPRMLTRSFVLFPLAEVAPDWRDPESGLKIEGHIMRLPLIDVDGLCWKGPF